MGDINKAVEWAINIANDNSHGYSQANRNGPDFDCSSLIATALNKAGFDVSVNSWTGNLKSQLLACGFSFCSSPFKKGDIHLNEKYHVCMSINENEIVQASISETGGITGQSGDQTGKEIWVTNYYEYSKGWDCHLRPPNSATKALPLTEIVKEVIAGKWGDGVDRKNALTRAGYNYDEIQSAVNQQLKNSGSQSSFNVDTIVQNTIDGLYGNYPERKDKIESLGFDYNEIQEIVNARLK